MRLSTKGRYGVKAMFDLARCYGKAPVSLRLLAKDSEISEPYLEQLFALLRKNGLVKSMRGAQGGYVLAMPPDKITVGDIIDVLEGPPMIAECLNDSTCGHAGACVIQDVWQKIYDSMRTAMDSITLDDMLKNYGKDPGCGQ